MMGALTDRVRSIERGAEIIWEWLGDGGITVDRTEAQRRADICKSCSQNKKGSMVVSAVADAIKRHVAVKNHLGLRVLGEKQLGECGICKCSLPLKIWVPQSVLKRHAIADEHEAFRSANKSCWQAE